MTSSKEDESSDKTTSSWGTWEELLLACAVKRHGLKNWDSVAMELQTKTSLPHLLTTAQFCKQKYMDLKRRFKDNHSNIPWLEHLRKVRVDELKQDLHRYDLSINCLQLKVKRLEEERDRCLDNNNTSNEPEPDLNQPNTSLNDDDDDKRPQKSEEPDKTCARLVSGDESDRENRSVNESNSTGLSDKVGGEGGGGGEGELVKSEADPCRSGLGGDGAGQGQGQGQGETTKEEESEELGDSVTQLSSDVQSSASYGRKKRKIGSGGDAKSEPLIELLDVIRTHKHASLFERRLKLQESSKYKEVVRQHVDLETIQTRVEQGTYSSCSLTNFYRDLLLVFNNAIVFFPKSSLESTTAHQLRRLVSIEINKETPTQKPVSSQEPPVSLPPQPKTTKPPHLERSDSLLDKQKSSAPIIVCRKRSSVSAKQSDDKKPATTDIKPSVERSSSLLKLKAPENYTITGTRSSRRNSSNNKNPTNTPPPPPPPPPSSSNKKQSTGTASGSKAGSASVDKQENSKTDNNKKTEASSASDKKKSVVDFLKRIKKNSPVQTAKKSNNKGVSEEPKRNNNNNNSSGKKDKKGKERQSSADRRQRKDTSPPKKNVGRPPKKAAETTPVTGKRAREEVVTKRQSKRSRR